MDTMVKTGKTTRRDHSPMLKARVLAECAEPGASVAKIAVAHGVGANLVHRWRRLDRERKRVPEEEIPAAKPALVAEAMPFVPVTVAATQASEATIDIELHRGALTLRASWPLSAAAQCAAWAREILR